MLSDRRKVALVIIWLNGAFGSGKTTCAFELQRRLPNAFVYDPEDLGEFLNLHFPKSLQENDFQDYPFWRQFNYAMLRQIAKEFDGIIIVPMTVTNRRYYDELIGRLMAEGITVKHYILSASAKTLKQRLNKRLEFGQTWGKRHIDSCIEAFENVITGRIIMTDQMTIDAIIEVIAEESSISLIPDKRFPVKKWIDRRKITLTHIRKG